MPPLEQSYREIPLTQGQFAIVDVEDFEWLSRWKWRAMWSNDIKSFYAIRSERRDTVLMHRVILGLEKGDRREGDHWNHKTLDNRRDNLRIATRRENRHNTRIKKNSTTGFKGVFRSKKRYGAKISIDGKRVYLGYRDTPEEAALLYANAAREHHGKFACH